LIFIRDHYFVELISARVKKRQREIVIDEA
jgi:hypothetical protein